MGGSAVDKSKGIWQKRDLVDHYKRPKEIDNKYNSSIVNQIYVQARIQKMLNLGAQQYKLSGWTGGRTFIFFVLHIRANRGAYAGCAPSKFAPDVSLLNAVAI